MWLVVVATQALPIVAHAQDGVAVMDSAGVEVVTSNSTAWTGGNAWSLAPEPRSIIGGVDAQEGQDVWHVGGFLRTNAGLYAVLSAGHSEVRVFDETGRFVRSFGGAGHGPGELSLYPPNGSIAYVPPDTVIVLDGDGIDVFRMDGTLVEARRVERQPGIFGAGTQTVPTAVLPDRSFLAVVHRFRPETPPAAGLFRPDQGMAVIPGLDGRPVLMGWYGGLEQELIPAGNSVVPLVTPFARRTVAAVGPSGEARFFIADTDQYEVRVFDSTGRLVRIVRREQEAVRVQDSWVEMWKQVQRQQDWRGQLPVMERAWREMTVPATLPAIEALAVDSEGFLWVLRPNGTLDKDCSYDVFNPAGRLLGSVEVPRGLQHHASWAPLIEQDRFVGVWLDEFGVESLRVYELNRR